MLGSLLVIYVLILFILGIITGNVFATYGMVKIFMVEELTRSDIALGVFIILLLPVLYIVSYILIDGCICGIKDTVKNIKQGLHK